MLEKEISKDKNAAGPVRRASGSSSRGRQKISLLPGAKALPPAAAPKVWDDKADVVVVGAGAAGLTAAVTAAEAGAEVIVLEKAVACGGDAYFAMATFGLGSRYAKKSGITQPPPPGAIFEAAMLRTSWRADLDVVRAMEERNDATLDWLEDMGVVYDPTFKWGPAVHTPLDPENLAAGYYHWHPYNVQGFIKTLEKRALALGVKILKNSPAAALISESGRVSGVVVKDKKGKKQFIGGKVTILAAGGFGANKEMLKQYAPPGQAATAAYYIGVKTNTGDGIRMAQGVGAEVEAMDRRMIWDGGVLGVGEGPSAFYSAATQLARQPSLSVNKLGKRFFNESAMFPSGPGLLFEAQANQVMRQKDATAFTIHDAETVQKKFLLERFDSLFCEHPCSWYEKSFEKWVAKGVIMKADSIEELAGLLGLAPRTLRATVDRYNEYCDQGEDRDYFKPAKYLAALRKPPFYAIKQVGGALVSTNGGLRINGSFQVLDKDWRPIPGLYAAGQTMPWAGELHQAFPSGRIAGEKAAQEALGKS